MIKLKKKLLNFSIKGKQTKVVNKNDIALLFGFLQSAEKTLEKLEDELQDARVIVHKMGKDFYRGNFIDRSVSMDPLELKTHKKKKPTS